MRKPECRDRLCYSTRAKRAMTVAERRVVVVLAPFGEQRADQLLHDRRHRRRRVGVVQRVDDDPQVFAIETGGENPA